MQTVEIEPEEPYPSRSIDHLVIVRAQPPDEIQDICVPPRPCREAFESGERIHGLAVSALPAHVSIHAVGVRPVSFDRHGGEAFLSDEPLGDLRPLPVELVRTMRSLPQENESRVADHVEQRIVVCCGPGQRHGRAGYYIFQEHPCCFHCSNLLL
jgi:hypothetical protein